MPRKRLKRKLNTSRHSRKPLIKLKLPRRKNLSNKRESSEKRPKKPRLKPLRPRLQLPLPDKSKSMIAWPPKKQPRRRNKESNKKG